MQPPRNTPTVARRLFRLCLHDGVLDQDRVRAIAGAFLRDRSRGRLAVLDRLLRLLQLYVARRTASVESAEPLPPDIRAALLDTLNSRYGPGLTAVFAERPALIGGLRIRVGSRLFDGSVRGRLVELEKTF